MKTCLKSLVASVALAGGLNCMAMAQSTWQTHHDPAGFEATYPSAWKADSAKGGTVLIHNENGTVFAFVLPFQLENGRAEEAIAPILKHETDLFPDARITQAQPVEGGSNEAVAQVSYNAHGLQARANVLCAISNGSGMLYAIGAPATMFDTEKANLVKILNSFKYVAAGNGGEAPGEGTTTGPLSFTSWSDPNEGMFTTNVPSGWRVFGGAYRFAPIDIRIQVSLLSQDGQIAVQDGAAKLTTLVNPGPSSQVRGLSEGGQYQVNGVTYTVLRYMTGEQFSSQYAQLKIKADHPDLQITGTKERPDLEEKIDANLKGATASIGETDFTFTEHGQPRQGAAMAATVQLGQSGGAWQAFPSYITAPADKMDLAWKAWDHLISDLSNNAAWSSQQSEITAQFNQLVIRNHEAAMQQIHDAYVKAVKRLDDNFRGWDNVVNGTTDIRDPGTGKVYSVAAGSNFYWKGENGIVGSNSAASPGVSFTPLTKF